MSNEQINKVCAVLNKETPDPDLIYKSVVAEPVIRNFENRLDVINNWRKKDFGLTLCPIFLVDLFTYIRSMDARRRRTDFCCFN